MNLFDIRLVILECMDPLFFYIFYIYIDNKPSNFIIIL